MSIADPQNLLLTLLTGPASRDELDARTLRVAAQRRLLQEVDLCLHVYGEVYARLTEFQTTYPDAPIPAAFAELAKTLRWEQ